MTALLEAPPVFVRAPAPVKKPHPPFWPDLDLWFDTLALLVLTGLGVYGFSTVYDGPRYLLSAGAGALVGFVTALVWRRFRLPAPVGLLLAAALALPTAVATSSGAGSLLGKVQHVLAASVTAWVHLLTTLPPAGAAGDLLVVPFLCGVIGVLGGVMLAGRMRRATWPALPPTVVLVLGALFGIDHPASALLQGTAFVVLALAWLALRTRRSATSPANRSPRRRAKVEARSLPAAAPFVALLAVAGLGATFVGPHLPFTGNHVRFVLRRHVEPPFDPRQYASPLTALRTFHQQDTQSVPQLSVTGLPSGAAIRVAVLDDYDGQVFGVSGSGTGGTFVRTGDALTTGPKGSSTVGVTVHVPSSVWLPVVGDPTAVTFQGPRAATVTSSFRWDATTESGVVPAALAAGDTYRLTTAVDPAPDPAVLATAAIDTHDLTTLSTTVPDAVKARAVALTAGQTTPFGQATALENALKMGYYSDGGAGTGVAPGHSWARIVDLLSTDSPVGDAEQYAPAMALMARSLGLPARVVMGYRPTGSGNVDVLGSDMTAWVQIGFDKVGWVDFFPTPDASRAPPQNPDSAPKVVAADAQPKPPVTPPQPPQLSDSDRRADGTTPAKPPVKAGHGLPAYAPYAIGGGGSLAVLIGWLVLVAVLRAGRRTRRRTDGTPSMRVSGAWAEVVDVACEAGRPISPLFTRPEAAAWLAVPGAAELAAHADALTFGQAPPTDADAAALWTRAAPVVAALRPVSRKRALARFLTFPLHARRRPELLAVLPGSTVGPRPKRSFHRKPGNQRKEALA